MVMVLEASLTASKVASIVRSPSDEVKVLLREVMEADRKSNNSNKAFKCNNLDALA